MKKVIKMVLAIVIGIIILLVLVSIVGVSSFNSNVEKEKEALFDANIKSDDKILLEDLDTLPDLVKNYLIKVGVVGKLKHCNVVFNQKGKIRDNPDKSWLQFTATQYMSSTNPGFIWKAKSLPMLIRDKSMNAKGEIKVSFLGIKNVAQFSGLEVDQSSLGRYLGELIWFPIGFLDSDISWKTIDVKSVKAIMIKGKLTLEGIFFFNQNGLIDRFETKRYRDLRLEDFIGEVGAYKNYDGLLLPESMTAIWNLKGRKFEYFKSTIVDYKITNTIH
ncbi:DUF6544 family protein [uncultured Aquimarina sp.]|uniref:DUF6544 family protein n=1 Tax=uncultured Aquimarina sp. TaxID=575652 RepID=UPI00260E8ED1|nr:DUF6544 family protein [uncultured Aquimarina sp.]